MTTKTIELEKQFFKGTRKYTLEEYKKVWKSPALNLWSFAIDYGNEKERELTEKVWKGIDNLSERAFEKIYNEQQGEKKHD